jgi:hypothetical protein
VSLLGTPLQIAKDLLGRKADDSPEAQLGIEQPDGTCGFTEEEIAATPPVETVEPDEDD